MKTFSLLSAAAALFAFVALPVRFEIPGTLLFAAGLVVMMHHDYRPRRTLKLPARRAARIPAVFRAPALRDQIEPHRLAA